MDSIRQTLTADLDELRAQDLDRRLRRLESEPGPRALVDGRPVLVLGSNDYLGLAAHPGVRAAAERAVARWGTGASGSRLTTGNLALHEELEQALALFKGTEAAVLFS